MLNLRSSYTYYLELSRSDAALGFDPTEFGWPSSLVSQFPAARLGGMFPRIDIDQFEELSRGTNPRTNKIYTFQPNVSMTRGKHNVRGGMDIRWTNVFREDFGNAGGEVTFDRQFTRRTLNSNSAFEGNGFASFLLGAPDGGSVPVNVFPHMQWTFVAPWIQDDWRVSNKLTLNLGFRWDFNSPVGEEQNRLNSTFDTTLVNPVSAQVGQQVLGGVTFVGVDGRPDNPWKYDKNNFQFRVGGAYQINDRTVLRAGYGKYFLNPTAESFLNGFSQSTPIISSIDGGRTPTYALANPWPDGILEPPGSSLGPLTFLGRGPGFSNPDFVVPNVHQFSAGIQRELPWQIALEATYVGSRSYDMQSQWNGFNEPSLDFVRQCDITQGGSRSFCDALLPNPFFGVAAFEGTTRFTNPTLSRFELNRPFPAFTGINMTERNDGRLWYDSAQFVANKRWSRGVTLNATYTWVPRWRNQGSDNGGQAFIDNITLEKVDGPYLRAPRASHHGVGRLGAAVARSPRSDRVPARRLVDRADVRVSVGAALGHAGQRRAARDPSAIALSPKKDGQFIYGVQALRRPAAVERLDPFARRGGRVRLHRAAVPRARTVPAPHDAVPLRRVPPAVVLAGGPQFCEDDADHQPGAAAGASGGVQPVQQPDVRRASVQRRHG